MARAENKLLNEAKLQICGSPHTMPPSLTTGSLAMVADTAIH